MLVIIGLIVGGILVGQSLIHSATIQATITQIDKFNTATNTFLGKYGYLPGDIPNAGSVGFSARLGTKGMGDGNGLLEPWSHWQTQSKIQWPACGETLLFWTDLSTSGLISEKITQAASGSTDQGNDNPTEPPFSTNMSTFFPAAKLGNSDFISVFSSNGKNYYALTMLVPHTGVVWPLDANGHLFSQAGLPVIDAYAIDAKIDDGIPNQGRVQASYPGANNTNTGTGTTFAYAPNAAAADATTCFDTTSNAYSTAVNSGSGINCGLSFQFQ